MNEFSVNYRVYYEDTDAAVSFTMSNSSLSLVEEDVVTEMAANNGYVAK